jgi:hypothetical protein
MSNNIQNFGNILAGLDTLNLPEGTVLFRGSHEGRREECIMTPRIKGVKYFHRKEPEALSYAQRENPNHMYKRDDATGVLFRIKLAASCTLLIFPNQAATYNQHLSAISEKWPNVLESEGNIYNPYWWRSFEQIHLFPFAREAKRNNNIAGYTSVGDEFLLDLDIIKFDLECSVLEQFTCKI